MIFDEIVYQIDSIDLEIDFETNSSAKILVPSITIITKNLINNICKCNNKP